jgi:hypothetical protein
MPRLNTAHPLNRPVFISDIAMMAVVGGKVRSFSELDILLTRSGFKLTKIYMVRASFEHALSFSLLLNLIAFHALALASLTPLPHPCRT